MPAIFKISSLTAQKQECENLFLKGKREFPHIKDNGVHLTANYKVNHATEIALNIIDRLSPIINKYPNFGKTLTNTCEKFIKVSEHM